VILTFERCCAPWRRSEALTRQTQPWPWAPPLTALSVTTAPRRLEGLAGLSSLEHPPPHCGTAAPPASTLSLSLVLTSAQTLSPQRFSPRPASRRRIRRRDTRQHANSVLYSAKRYIPEYFAIFFSLLKSVYVQSSPHLLFCDKFLF